VDLLVRVLIAGIAFAATVVVVRRWPGLLLSRGPVPVAVLSVAAAAGAIAADGRPTALSAVDAILRAAPSPSFPASMPWRTSRLARTAARAAAPLKTRTAPARRPAVIQTRRRVERRARRSPETTSRPATAAATVALVPFVPSRSRRRRTWARQAPIMAPTTQLRRPSRTMPSVIPVATKASQS